MEEVTRLLFSDQNEKEVKDYLALIGQSGRVEEIKISLKERLQAHGLTTLEQVRLVRYWDLYWLLNSKNGREKRWDLDVSGVGYIHMYVLGLKLGLIKYYKPLRKAQLAGIISALQRKIETTVVV